MRYFLAIGAETKLSFYMVQGTCTYFFLDGPIETDPPFPFKPGYTLNMTVKYIYTACTLYRASIPYIDTVIYALVMDRSSAAKYTSCPKSRIGLFYSVPL